MKGANLAMERVDAAMHGWTQAPYDTKAETDANYKRLIDWSIDRERLRAVGIGVASHNVFDVAWVKLLADARGVTECVHFEMLQGMAPGVARVVRDATGGVLLYTPIVAADDFDHALAYLFRRLEENSRGDNFLRHLFDLAADADAFAVEQARFEVAVADRRQVSSRPRRLTGKPRVVHGFDNEPDADPTDRDVRAAILAAVAAPLRRRAARGDHRRRRDRRSRCHRRDGSRRMAGHDGGSPSQASCSPSPTSSRGAVRN